MEKKIYYKLAQIQKELIAPKNQRNDFGKYNYRSCEDILNAVKPLLDKYGCVLFLNNELLNMGDRFYVEATATVIDTEDGGYVTVKAQAREEEQKKGMDGSQITGASSSYARKYALAGLFCIDNEEDSDSTNTHGMEEKPVQKQKPVQKKPVTEVVKETANKVAAEDKKPGLATPQQIASIQKLMKQKGVFPVQIASRYKLNDFKEMTEAQANDCIKGLMASKDI